MSDSLSSRLTEARNSLHLLMTGKQARVVVDQNGERVEFTMTNAAQLQAYINSLEAGGAIKPAGPIRFIF